MNNLIYFSEEEAYIIDSLINGLDETHPLKSALKKKLSAVYNFTSMVSYVHKKDIAERVEMLGQAIREKRKVILKDYESANSKGTLNRLLSQRTV